MNTHFVIFDVYAGMLNKSIDLHQFEELICVSINLYSMYNLGTLSSYGKVALL
jgi:hypothetical protein